MALLDHQVLLFEQRAKAINLTNEHLIYDAAGEQIGSVLEVEQNAPLIVDLTLKEGS